MSAYPVDLEEPKPLPMIHLLMVEDSDGDVFLVKSMLKGASTKFDYTVHAVPRLIDAFQSMEQQTYDVVMLDLNLLDIDGISSISALHAEFPSIPIIVYSGMDDPTLHRRALQCGATAYLVKGQQTEHDLCFSIEQALLAEQTL